MAVVTVVAVTPAAILAAVTVTTAVVVWRLQVWARLSSLLLAANLRLQDLCRINL